MNDHCEPNAGHPTTRTIFTESWFSLVSHPLSSVTSVLITALVCLIALGTAGRTAATEQAVLSTINSVGTTLITVTDSTGQAAISSKAIEILSDIDGVQWVFGLGSANDATLPGIDTTHTGTPVTSRTVIGTIPAEISLISGREPLPGEAIAGTYATQELALADGAGDAVIKDSKVAVVGTFTTADGPLATLNETLLVAPYEPGAETIRYLYIRSQAEYDIEAIAQLVQDLLPTSQPHAVTVEVADGALQLRDALSGTLTESSRQILALVLVLGLALIFLNTTATITSRRRDFGRQRAIGATRSALVVIVLLQTTIAALIGSALGTTAGLTYVIATAGAAPSPDFTIGIFALSTLAATLGALTPAIVASRRDPVRILRVP